MTPGRAKSHAEDGTIVEAVYSAGETRHFVYRKNEYKVHDLENVGDADLWFTTVEFLGSVNAPLKLGQETRGRNLIRGSRTAGEERRRVVTLRVYLTWASCRHRPSSEAKRFPVP